MNQKISTFILAKAIVLLLCAFGLPWRYATAQPIGGTKLISNTAANYDYPNIQFAIYDCVTKGIAPGGVIFNIQAGDTFVEPALLIDSAFGSSADKPVIFRRFGNGPKPVIMTNGSLNPALALLTFYTGDAAFTIDRASYITFDGIKIQDKPSFFFSSERLEIGFALYKSNTKACSNITIKNCEIVFDQTQQFQVGIYLPEYNVVNNQTTQNTPNNLHNNITIEKNRITGAFQGIMLGVATVSSFNYFNKACVIDGNIIEELTTANQYRSGIYAQFVDSLIISNNKISTTQANTAGSSGIALYGNIGRYEISNNTITISDSLETVGINLHANCDSSAQVSNNLIINSKLCYKAPFAVGANAAGILLASTAKQITIENNEVRNNEFLRLIGGNASPTGGIVLRGAGQFASVLGNVVSNNFLRDWLISFYGIYISAQFDSTNISGNTISNQVVEEINTQLNFHGIGGLFNFVNSSSDFAVRIEKNVIEQTDTCSYFVGVLSQNLRPSYIIGNTIRNAKTSNTAHGIYVNNTDNLAGVNTWVENNRIYNLMSLPGNTIGVVNGIKVTSGNTTEAQCQISVVNNMVSGFNQIACQARGIHIQSSLQKIKVQQNSVSLVPFGSQTNNISAALFAFGSTQQKNILLQNNLLKLSGTNSGTQKWAALYLPLCQQHLDTLSNYNNLLINPTDTNQVLVAGSCFSAFDTVLNTLVDIGNHFDYCMVNNLSVPVNFVDNDTDLHLAGASVCDFNLQMPRIFTVLKDIDGNPRYTTTATGADEGTIATTPTLTTPTANATNVVVNPTFAWNNASVSPAYQIQVATDNSFSNVLIDKNNVSSTNYNPTTNLQPNTTYYWRVRAVTNSECNGDWSSVRSFTTAQTVSVEEVTVDEFSLYPNPTQAFLQVTFQHPELAGKEISITNLLGEEILNITVSAQNITLDVSPFANGFYLIKCGTAVKRFQKF